MGKRPIVRARGKGGPPYKSPGHRFAGEIKYPRPGEVKVIDIIHDPARSAPLAVLKDKEKREHLVVAAEGIAVGDVLSVGRVDARPAPGVVMPLKAIPKGSFIFAIESFPQSGPKFCCAAGTRASIIAHEKNRVIVQMPSKEFKEFNPNCLATVGIPAGAGRGDKPFVKAGQAYYKMRARNKLWPRTSAVCMNAVDHPFGGQTKPGQPKSVSRWAPPGAKVGSIAPRRMGRRKRK